eukprot:4213417-Pleurochrysis_carterae.AAC.2
MTLERMRQVDPPAGTRKLSRAFKAGHLRAAAAAGVRSNTEQSRMDWAAALLAHNLLLRAGELSHPDDRGFDPTRDLTWRQWSGASHPRPAGGTAGC